MINRTKSFVSVLTLIIYGTLAFVSVPLHFHQDVLLSSGTGMHAFAQHADALHCQHQSIESHSDCTLCSITSSFHYSIVTATIPPSDPLRRDYSTVLPSFSQQQLDNFLSRRGPPAFLG